MKGLLQKFFFQAVQMCFKKMIQALPVAVTKIISAFSLTDW